MKLKRNYEKEETLKFLEQQKSYYIRLYVVTGNDESMSQCKELEKRIYELRNNKVYTF